MQSFAEFQQIYGAADDLNLANLDSSALSAAKRSNHLAHAARAFFDNGGAKLYVSAILAGDSEPRAADFAAALLSFQPIAEITAIAAPGASVFDDGPAITQALVAHAQQQRTCIAVLDPPPAITGRDVKAARAAIDSSYAALYYPWIVGENSLSLPPSGFVCGLYAQSDSARGVAHAPANLPLAGALGLERQVTEAEAKPLNSSGVNCIRAFPSAGIRLWGARTASSNPEWRYVNLRRYAIYLEQSVSQGMQWTVFEPNGPTLWAVVKQDIAAFLYNEWRSGALQGAKSEQAFFVNCDAGTMTQDDIDQGRLIILVGFALLRPAEFVILRFELTAAEGNSAP